jgi:hypothetical protein
VIGALVKNDSSEVINFLLTTEIIPLCLRIMETGSELSKTVAIFIVQKILLDDNGLNYICATYERFYAVGTVLSNMVNQLVESQTARLLKHVVRCFLRSVPYCSPSSTQHRPAATSQITLSSLPVLPLWHANITLYGAGLATMPGRARLYANVYQSHSKTIHFHQSSETTQPLNGAFLSFTSIS